MRSPAKQSKGAVELYDRVTHRDWGGAADAYERVRNAEAVEAIKSEEWMSPAIKDRFM